MTYKLRYMVIEWSGTDEAPTCLDLFDTFERETIETRSPSEEAKEELQAMANEMNEEEAEREYRAKADG